MSEGNDAPRGGQTGDFVIVEFTLAFKAIAAEYQASVDAAARAEAERVTARNEAIRAEVESLPIDDDFINDIRTGVAMDKATSYLMNRRRVTQVTYFWDVARILRKKALQD